MSKISFEFERMEPFKYPDPRDLRSQLKRKMCWIHNNKKISEIPLCTEIILKYLKSKNSEKPDRPLLKYKIINLDWEETKFIKTDKFSEKNFSWMKEYNEFGEFND